MADDKVRVFARAGAVCPDFDAADREPPVRRAIGRKYQEVKPGQFAWVSSGAAESVAKRAEIARALADGDLLPADEETAAWARSITRGHVVFDPSVVAASLRPPPLPNALVALGAPLAPPRPHGVEQEAPATSTHGDRTASTPPVGHEITPTHADRGAPRDPSLETPTNAGKAGKAGS